MCSASPSCLVTPAKNLISVRQSTLQMKETLFCCGLTWCFPMRSMGSDPVDLYACQWLPLLVTCWPEVNLLHPCSERSRFGGRPNASFLLLEERLAPCRCLCSVELSTRGGVNSSYCIYLVNAFQILSSTLGSESPKFKPCLHGQQRGLCCL